MTMNPDYIIIPLIFTAPIWPIVVIYVGLWIADLWRLG
jgi:hypothetical protein